jgi:hypothetical protein
MKALEQIAVELKRANDISEGIVKEIKGREVEEKKSE